MQLLLFSLMMLFFLFEPALLNLQFKMRLSLHEKNGAGLDERFIVSS